MFFSCLSGICLNFFFNCGCLMCCFYGFCLKDRVNCRWLLSVLWFFVFLIIVLWMCFMLICCR